MGGQQAAPRLEEPTEECAGDPERRVGHHVVRPAGQAKIAGVGLDDDDGVAEPLAEEPRPPGVRLDGDHPSAGGHQRSGERTGAGTDVDDAGHQG